MSESSMSIYEKVRDRLIRYAKINTQSAHYEGTWPTTARQRDLAEVLFRELREIGASDVFYDEENCVVYAKIPSNLPCEAEPLGLIAHMDTAPDASGENVRPWVLTGYDGGDIILNKEKNIIMHRADYENLGLYVGQDLILTDGTTLLGGDDKASIAAIMTMAEHLLAHPEIPRGPIALAFTQTRRSAGSPTRSTLTASAQRPPTRSTGTTSAGTRTRPSTPRRHMSRSAAEASTPGPPRGS